MADDPKQQKQHKSTVGVPQREAMMRMNYLYQVRKRHIGVFDILPNILLIIKEVQLLRS